MTNNDKATQLWIHYLSRRRADDYEPHWVHPAYEMMQHYNDLSTYDQQEADEIIESHDHPDGACIVVLPGLSRIVHDGWLLGTPTWVFMGRNLSGSPIERHGDWIILGRPIPHELRTHVTPKIAFAWIAYHMDRPMGFTCLTAECIGPCNSREEVLELLDAEMQYEG